VDGQDVYSLNNKKSQIKSVIHQRGISLDDSSENGASHHRISAHACRERGRRSALKGDIIMQSGMLKRRDDEHRNWMGSGGNANMGPKLVV